MIKIFVRLKDLTLAVKFLYIVELLFILLIIFTLVALAISQIKFLEVRNSKFISEMIFLFFYIWNIAIVLYAAWGLWKLFVDCRKSGFWMQIVSFFIGISNFFTITIAIMLSSESSMYEESEIETKNIIVYEGFLGLFLSFALTCIVGYLYYLIHKLKKKGVCAWSFLQNDNGFFRTRNQLLFAVLLGEINYIFWFFL